MKNTFVVPILYTVMLVMVLGLMWVLSGIADDPTHGYRWPITVGQIQAGHCYTLDLRTMQEVACPERNSK